GQLTQALVLPHAEAKLVAVHARHDEVHQHQVRLLVIEQPERLQAITGAERPIVVPLQDAGHHLADGGTIVDDENAGTHDIWKARRPVDLPPAPAIGQAGARALLGARARDHAARVRSSLYLRRQTYLHTARSPFAKASHTRLTRGAARTASCAVSHTGSTGKPSSSGISTRSGSAPPITFCAKPMPAPALTSAHAATWSSTRTMNDSRVTEKPTWRKPSTI